RRVRGAALDPGEGVGAAEVHRDVALVPASGVGRGRRGAADRGRGLVDVDPRDGRAGAVAGLVGGGAGRGLGRPRGAQGDRAGAAGDPRKDIGTEEARRDVAVVPAVGVGRGAAAAADRGPGLVDVDPRDGRAGAVAGVVGGRAGDALIGAFGAERHVRRAARDPGERVGAGEVHRRRAAVVPAGGDGRGRRGAADRGRGLVDVDPRDGRAGAVAGLVGGGAGRRLAGALGERRVRGGASGPGGGVGGAGGDRGDAAVPSAGGGGGRGRAADRGRGLVDVDPRDGRAGAVAGVVGGGAGDALIGAFGAERHVRWAARDPGKRVGAGEVHRHRAAVVPAGGVGRGRRGA